MARSPLPHILIVGGGAGGLVLATRLGRSLGRRRRAAITLVDAQLTHIWKPLLHEVAAGSLNPYEDELNYFAQAQRNGFAFQPGRMIGLDRAAQTILLDEMHDETGETLVAPRRIHYDWLVLAVGSRANDFGTPGAGRHCIYLDTRAQAERLHRALLNCYYQAKALGEAGAGLEIAIVGAGATGVELAAELHFATRAMARYGLDEIAPARVHIALLEAAERILPALPERIAQRALRRLQDLGIEVLTGEKVEEVAAGGIRTAAGRWVPARLKVWSAGIRAPDLLRNLDGLENGWGNALAVDDRLRTTRDPRIFALGDCAHCVLATTGGRETAVPPRAQAAHQQAQWLARALPRMIAGRPVAPFVYRDRGSLVSLSREGSVGQLMGNLTGRVDLEGWLARRMYLALYRQHQATLHGWPRMLLFVLKDLLGRSTGPREKLH
ncbi:MAG: NAD(P)/FAD-dependent oxidoreductase [Pseudomonadota bacterium]